MKKILIIQEVITAYRVPVFNELNKIHELTVMFSKGNVPVGANFKTLKIDTFVLCSRFKVHKKNVINICKKFDVVISIFNLSFLYVRLLPYFLPKKIKLIYWGIGVSASYNDRFDFDKSGDKTRLKFLKMADASLFYSDYPIKKYNDLGIDKRKLFVANNTVFVVDEYEESIDKFRKDKIIFIGTLYAQKKIDVLIEQYKLAFIENIDIPDLFIIGDGDYREQLEDMIESQGLMSKVFLMGEITNLAELSKYLYSSYLSFSPDQAGLSVLMSMGHGVPFVTSKNAITGGEIFNIKNGENGILLDSLSEIKNIILDLSKNPAPFLEMGKKAREYYRTFRTVGTMVKGFDDAINYVTNNKA